MQSEIKTSRFNVVNFGKTTGTQSVRVQELYKKKSKKLKSHRKVGRSRSVEMRVEKKNPTQNLEYPRRISYGLERKCGI